MVGIVRFRQIKQHLQQPMETGCGEQILPAGHVGDASPHHHQQR
jgi:hypothetical protein